MSKKQTDTKQKQSKPDYTILSGDDVRKVQNIGRAIEKSEGSNRPQIVAILEANKKHHAGIGAEIQKAARQAGLTTAPQTLKNWVYKWRKDNGLTAAADEDNKGGQTNEANEESQALLNEEGGTWDCLDMAQHAIICAFMPFVEKALQSAGEFPDDAAQSKAFVCKHGGKAALAFSRFLDKQAQAKAQPLTDKEKADAKKAAKPAKAKGNRNTKTKVTA
jgi:transposase-like protein